MKFRAVAVQHERSNAAGAVELECAPLGLSLVYQGAFASNEGYAPGALAVGRVLAVPWAGIQKAELEGELFHLELSPELTPLNRFSLLAFSSGEDTPPSEELVRRRFVLRIGSAGLALSLAASTLIVAARAGAGASLSLAATLSLATALAVAAVGLFADRLLAPRRLEGDLARELFVAEFARHAPGFVRAPPRERPRLRLELRHFERVLPRTTLAVAITLTAALLGVLLTTRVIVIDEAARSAAGAQAAPLRQATPPVVETPPAPLETVPSASKPTSQAGLAVAAGDVASVGESCHCLRSDSLLWAEAIPRLSVVVISERVRLRRGEDDQRRKKYVEAELAVVNNGSRDLGPLAFSAEFYERDPPPSNKRYLVSKRPLFYEGPLGPARAIKWSVEAEGSELEVPNPVPGDIGGYGDDAAPANLFMDLLTANHRPVRLHGALMLTFLGDPRAHEALLGLREALREDEGPFLTRLLHANAPLKVCKLEVDRAQRTAGACLFNAGAEARGSLGVRVRALAGPLSRAAPLSPPPDVVGELRVHVPGEIAAGQGARLRFAFDPGPAAGETYEAFADRFDLLAE